MSCPLRSNINHKALTKDFGLSLADQLVRAYTKAQGQTEFVYPTTNEAVAFMNQQRRKAKEEVSALLSDNPYVSSEMIIKALKPMIALHKGQHWVIKGDIEKAKIDGRELTLVNAITGPNATMMEALAEEFPSAIELEHYPGRYNTVVKVINAHDRLVKDQTEIEQEVDDIYERSLYNEEEDLDKAKARSIAEALGAKLSAALKINYEIISEAEAMELLMYSKTPYNYQGSFFFKNKVYFVKGNFNVQNVLHEFSHPLIKGIAQDNPVLFNKLFNDLSVTDEGKAILQWVRDLYPNLEEDSDRFKEEVLVHSLEKKTYADVSQQTTTESAFEKFMNKLLFALKQILRKLAGRKVNLKTLSQDTTLEELANMMVNEDFVVENLNLKLSDFADFKEDIKEVIEAIQKDEKALQEVLNMGYVQAKAELNALRSAPWRLKEELRGDQVALNNIRNILKSYQTVEQLENLTDEQVVTAMELEQDELKARASSFVNSISQLKVFTDAIHSKLIELKKSKAHLTHNGAAKILFYKGFLVNQNKFLSDIRETINLNSDNPFSAKIESIRGTIEDSLRVANKATEEFVVEFFVEGTDIMTDAVETKLKSKLHDYLKNDYTEKELETVFKKLQDNRKEGYDSRKVFKSPISKRLQDEIDQYYAKRLGREEIQAYLKGEKADLGIATSLLVPYGNIDDPIIGGLPRYVRTKLSDMQSKSYKTYNKILVDIGPQLKAIGYNPNSTQQLADMLLFTDKIATQSEDGSFEEFEVLTFLNEYKDYRLAQGKIQYELDKAKEEGDQAKIIQALGAKWDFEDRYMNRPMVDEYYDVKNMWNQQNIVVNPDTGKNITISKELSQEAYLERKRALDKMRIWSHDQMNDSDHNYKVSEWESAQADFNQLYNVYDLAGEIKKGDDLKKVLVRKAHRERSSKFYTYTPNMEKIQKDFDYFIKTYLPSLGISEKDKEYKEQLEKFTKANFRVAYSEKYHKKFNQLMRDLNEINKKYEGVNPTAAELSRLYQKRSNLIRSIQDRSTRLPDGSKLTENQQKTLIETERSIIKLQGEYDKKSGLTKEDAIRLRELTKKISDSETNKDLTKEELDEYDRLFTLSSNQGMSTADTTRYRQIMSELGSLRDKEATPQYIEAFQHAIAAIAMNDPHLSGTVLQDAITPEIGISIKNADAYINNPEIINLLLQSPDFSKWFNMHHYKRTIWTPEGPSEIWVRTAAWDIKKPSAPEDYLTTKLVNPITEEEIQIQGVPNSRYTESTIKEEYLTIKPSKDRNSYIGKVIDNNGNYLPRSLKDMKERVKQYPEKYDNSNPYDKFINYEYLKLKDKGGPQYELLEKLKKAQLDIQDKKPGSSKLYLDLARYRQKGTLESWQSGKTQKGAKAKVEKVKESILALIQPRQDDAERYFNYETVTNLVNTDLNGNPIESVPISGLYKIKKADVSRDVLGSLFKYLHSINEQEAKIEIQPLAESIKDVFNNPNNAIKDINTASKNILRNTGKYVPLMKKGNRRKNAIEHYIDKVIYGQVTADFETENPIPTKIANLMMHNASRAFIMLDIPSALKNRWGMMFQSMIEASGGKYVTHRTLAEGRIWSAKSMAKLTTKAIYSRGPKDLDIQIIEEFDPITGKTKKDFGKSSSRTFIKDFFDGTWMYDSRRFMDFEAGLQLFGGMMHNKYIEQVLPSGEKKKIKYINAWELDQDKNLKLKDGIDPSYANSYIDHTFIKGDTWESIAEEYHVTVEELKKRNKGLKLSEITPGDNIIIARSEKFNDFKLKVQGLGKKLNGQTDDMDSAQANKYLGYRLFTFYKRYAIPMFMNRFAFDTDKANRGGDVYDWDMGGLTKGYYIEGFQALRKVLSTGEKYLPLMTPEEKIALKKIATEGAALAILGIIIGGLFGYDAGDEDRFAKMRKREEELGLGGWAVNHLLYQAIMVKMENEAFIPLPGVGLSDWFEYGNNTTISIGPTLGMYGKILIDLKHMAFGNDKAIYQQDAGPYLWQKEGNYKLWNHLFSLFGIKGKTYDPITAVKKSEIFENSKFQ